MRLVIARLTVPRHFLRNLVRSRGLEPPRLAALAPQASASASSATTAFLVIISIKAFLCELFAVTRGKRAEENARLEHLAEARTYTARNRGLVAAGFSDGVRVFWVARQAE